MARFGLRNSKANAATLLREYHHKLENLFAAFDKSRDKRLQKRMLAKMLVEVSAHAKTKEKLFFAALGTGSRSKEMARFVDEALEERHVATLLMRKVQALHVADKRYEASLTMVADSIKHHVREKEKDLFRMARATKLAFERLSERANRVSNRRSSRMARRKA